jgi:hypothetical protein
MGLTFNPAVAGLQSLAPHGYRAEQQDTIFNGVKEFHVARK